MLKVINRCIKLPYITRNFVIYTQLYSEEKIPKRKVKETVELITLVDTDDKILGLKPKTEAVNLARKLNLILERVTDTKYGKVYPAYKMFTSADLLQEEKKSEKAQNKTLKRLPINSQITDHDLQTKINTVRKWLMKNCEVHIAILSNGQSEALRKSIFKKIEESLKDEGRLIDVRHKEDALKFIIIPPKQPKINASKNSKTDPS